MNAICGAVGNPAGIQATARTCTGSRCLMASYQTSPACTLRPLCSREEFQYVLERARTCALASGDMPLFCDDESRTSDPGNRCKLRFRHALLMSPIRKKNNPTQSTLQAIFGIDQTNVCMMLRIFEKFILCHALWCKINP